MARTVEDCRLLENLMAGPHRDDIVSLRPKLTIPADLPGVGGLRIAASADLGGFEVAPEVRENLREAAGVFRSLGAAVDEVGLALDIDDLREAARAHFAAIFGSLIRRSLARHRDLMTSYAIAFAEDAGEPNVGYYRSLEIESEVYAQVADVLEDHDLLITPVFGVPALKATARVRHRRHVPPGPDARLQPVQPLPRARVPCGRSREGVPLGVQVVGRTYDDVSVFRAAAAFAAARPWFDDPATRPFLKGAPNELQRTLQAPPAVRRGRRRGGRGRARGRPRDGPRRHSRSDRRAPNRLTLRIGWTSQPDNLNPFIGWQNVTYQIWSINYGFLFGFGSDNSPTLDLAREFPTEENGGISADGTVWTIKLRQGVKWSDGQPFTAEDVAFTYNYIVKNRMLNMAITTVGIEEAEALAPDVVRITCSRPKADMMHIFLPILPRHVWEKVDPDEAQTSYANKPPIVGTGPFITTAFKKGSYVRMERNPYDWGTRPTLDELLFEYYTNGDTMTADLKSGASTPPGASPRRSSTLLASVEGLQPVAYNFFNWDYLSLNCYDGKSLATPCSGTGASATRSTTRSTGRR